MERARTVEIPRGRGLIVMDTITRTHLGHLRFAGYSERTIAARASVLKAVRELGPLLRLDGDQLMEWLSRPGLMPESRRAYRSHLRGFYAWALDRSLIATDPTRNIPTVRVPRAMPRPMSREDFLLAVDVADARMRAWLLLGALAGLRAMEIAALLPADLTVTDEGLAVLVLRVAKGGSVGVIPVHDALLAALLRSGGGRGLDLLGVIHFAAKGRPVCSGVLLILRISRDRPSFTPPI